MKLIKFLFKVAIAFVMLFIVLAFFGPKKYTVTRSIEIDSDIEIVWEQVADFKNWENWSPWFEVDPSAEYTYTGTMSEVGAKSNWNGDDNLSGTGSMEITSIERLKSFDYILKFKTPFEMQSKGGMVLNEKNGKTTVTWVDKGDFNFMIRPFMLFMDLDEQLGPQFERGLFKIDSITTLQ